MKVLQSSPDPARPFANLLPLVESLEDGGNDLLDDGFQLSQAGWACRFARPIDFALLRAKFEVPDSITFSDETDTVLDRNSWCAIEGPGADLSRLGETQRR